MSYVHIEVDTHIGPVGAVVSGVDLSEQLNAEVVAEIHAAWLQHHVLFFRDQTLSPSAQARFASYFGELDQYPFMQPVDESAYVIPIIKEADATMNFGGDWHTDTSYKLRPPKATLLYAVEVPEQGGDTLFADATAAYQALSPAMRESLERWQGIYSPKLVHGQGGGYKSVAAKANLGQAYGGDADFAESEVEHPLIRTHEETGRKSIYCSKPHTVNIKGWSREESLAIFRFLTKHLTQEQFVTRFKWQAGSLAMWDNRCMFHNALNDYQGHRRHMHRVIVKGERPQ
ncbi:MAG: TauD/TfdA family dioxygenase [Pseudomonadota bacterium]|nr:TauD/TfdA family dioxygenase [Pseudomonadota bacterium]